MHKTPLTRRVGSLIVRCNINGRAVRPLGLSIMPDNDPAAEPSAEKVSTKVDAETSSALPKTLEKGPESSEAVAARAEPEAVPQQRPAPALAQPPTAEQSVDPQPAAPANKAAWSPVSGERAIAKSSVKPARASKLPARTGKPSAAIKKAGPRQQAASKTRLKSKSPSSSRLKETTMQTNAKINEGIQEMVSDAQAKAKKAVEKGGSLLSEAGEFTKGNIEAVVESGKILASGLQSMGKDLVADGRSTFELVSSEAKDLAAVKSPSEFVKVQSDIVRKNLDTAMAMGSKNSEAMLKLVSDVFAPISGRFNLAAEKVRKLGA
jgi:hypothetical protein